MGYVYQMPWNHDFVTSNLFLYLLNVFMQYHWNKYYCKLKVLFFFSLLFSPTSLSHVWWLEVLSV